MEVFTNLLLFALIGVLGIVLIVLGCILKAKATRNQRINNRQDEVPEEDRVKNNKQSKALVGIQRIIGQILFFLGLILLVVSACWFVFKWKQLF